jgi:hypothetical protein
MGETQRRNELKGMASKGWIRRVLNVFNVHAGILIGLT